MNWDNIIKKVAPYVVRISTPTGSGTGFYIGCNDNKRFSMIATALHVVADADDWQQPIRLHDHTITKTVLLKEDGRVVFRDEVNDSAVLMLPHTEFGLPEEIIPLRPINLPLDIGAEIGWLGFPGIEPNTLCFFSGNVSARRDDRRVYFVDGVAINGVSGGPVLYCSETAGVQFVGVVSAYRANRLTGDTLPGLLVSQDVTHGHNVLRYIKSLDEASKKKAELAQTQDSTPGAPPREASEPTDKPSDSSAP